MTTRREFMGYLPAAGAAFAVVGNMVLGEGPARAQDAAAPLDGHFHPKGKAPSKFTLDVLQQAKGTLPFADQRDFEELKRGFIAPMPDLKIMADAGHVAWDMERFQFLNEDRDFDSIHPSLLRQSRLNNNYGLYEVIPGIYQVRGVDLSDSRSFAARPAGSSSTRWSVPSRCARRGSFSRSMSAKDCR